MPVNLFLNNLCDRIRQLLAENERVLVAIDGNCAAGKTTLARQLQEQFDCNVFQMDEFFLQPHQRTPERFSEAGGNVDYQRFRQEVLLPLTRGEEVCYQPYDCHIGALTAPVTVAPKPLTIVEGTYSCHPFFEDPYDLRIFLPVSPEIQRQRILLRPEHLHQRFFSEWIPMEQQYFDVFRIPEHCHIVRSSQEEI